MAMEKLNIIHIQKNETEFLFQIYKNQLKMD